MCPQRSRTSILPLPSCHTRLIAPRPLPASSPKSLKTLGDHIRKRRLELGLLQCEVAELLGVGTSTIWNWESNARTPTYRYYGGIVRFLDYNPFPRPASLGEELVLYRKLRGLSQKQMAQVLGVDPTTLARWERGQRLPSAKQMGRIQELCQGCYGASCRRTVCILKGDGVGMSM